METYIDNQTICDCLTYSLSPWALTCCYNSFHSRRLCNRFMNLAARICSHSEVLMVDDDIPVPVHPQRCWMGLRSIAHQLLGAGGESGSPGRLSCLPPALLLLFLSLGDPPAPVGHPLQEGGLQPLLAPLPHPQTPLGAEDGLQRAGRKREEEC